MAMIPMEYVGGGTLRLGDKAVSITFTASSGLNDYTNTNTTTKTWSDTNLMGFYATSNKPSVTCVGVAYNSSNKFRFAYYNMSDSSSTTFDIYPLYKD